MTLYREEPANTFNPWAGEDINNVRHPLNIEHLWSDGELANVGLYRPSPSDPVPDGKMISATRVARVGGVVRFVNELDDLPASVTYTISKADIWRRCTEPEADILHDLLATQSARLQGIFNGASFISTDDELYATLSAGITAALGEARANAILAPSGV